MDKIRYIFFIALLSIIIVSCQKDQNIKDVPTLPAATNPALLAMVSGPGNFLASSGTLSVTIDDSTYTFDAQKDSIAFVNLYLDNKQYFGLTAINKSHNMSFGISSAGYAQTNIDNKVAGTQFLLTKNKANLQYALTQYANLQDSSFIKISAFAQDSTLAKGNFVTFLNDKTKTGKPFYRVTGIFNLKIK
ncbi:MAG: hypothetical protein ABI367_14640 [Mucilaginibacter sp.]